MHHYTILHYTIPQRAHTARTHTHLQQQVPRASGQSRSRELLVPLRFSPHRMPCSLRLYIWRVRAPVCVCVCVCARARTHTHTNMCMFVCAYAFCQRELVFVHPESLSLSDSLQRTCVHHEYLSRKLTSQRKVMANSLSLARARAQSLSLSYVAAAIDCRYYGILYT